MGYEILYSTDTQFMTLGIVNKTGYYITNNGSKPIIFENRKNIKIEEMPLFEDGPRADDPPGFYVTFNYGETGGAIATIEDGKAIELESISAKGWQIQKRFSNEIGAYWVVIPNQKQILDPQESLIFNFYNIKCNITPGLASLRSEFWIDGVRDKKTIGITKVVAPKIKSFKSEKQQYKIGDKAKFMWQLEDAQNCATYFDGMLLSPTQKEFETIVTKVQYQLLVMNKAEYFVSEFCVLDFVSIDKFQLMSFKSNLEIKIEWETKNAESCWISHFGNVETTGNRTYATNKNELFILKAKDRFSNREYEKKLEFNVPIIDSLTAKILSSNQLYASLDMNGFYSLDELSENDLIIGSMYEGPDPPKPKTKKVQILWSTRNAKYCKFSFSSIEYPSSGETTVELSASTSYITLWAIHDCDFNVARNVNV